MIHISDFETKFKGRKFRDAKSTMLPEMVCCGYGDNQGNPYFVGLYDDNQNRTNVATVLLKNAEFSPVV